MSNHTSFWRVEEQWRGATAAILGGGPSLTQEQVDRLRGRAKVIATNDQIRLAPWAEIHYFCDEKWWRWHREKDWYRSYAGIRVTLENPDIVKAEPSIRSLRNHGWNETIRQQHGLTDERDGVLTGRNGGYQALHLAVHLGAKRILLLGFDMRDVNGRSHWFGEHPDKSGTEASTWRSIRRHFDHLKAPLARRGIEVLNCTPGSAIETFPKVALESVLPDPQPAALPA